MFAMIDGTVSISANSIDNLSINGCHNLKDVYIFQHLLLLQCFFFNFNHKLIDASFFLEISSAGRFWMSKSIVIENLTSNYLFTIKICNLRCNSINIDTELVTVRLGFISSHYKQKIRNNEENCGSNWS